MTIWTQIWYFYFEIIYFLKHRSGSIQYFSRRKIPEFQYLRKIFKKYALIFFYHESFNMTHILWLVYTITRVLINLFRINWMDKFRFRRRPKEKCFVWRGRFTKSCSRFRPPSFRFVSPSKLIHRAVLGVARASFKFSVVLCRKFKNELGPGLPLKLCIYTWSFLANWNWQFSI